MRQRMIALGIVVLFGASGLAQGHEGERCPARVVVKERAGPVRRAVVDHDDFDRPGRLGLPTVERLPKPDSLAVETRR